MSQKKEPLAIVGLGCRYPGNANSPKQFWEMLCNKVDALTTIPADRWDVNDMYAPEWRRAGKINNKRGGFVDRIDMFDAGFFGISPLEATRMDVQQRMLLQVTYEAFEDAGLSLDDLSDSPTACFIGISAHDYGDIQNTPGERVNIGSHTNVGGALSIAANRISYVFNLKGVSIALDTACSSSLNAVHMACRAIWYGDATMAIAGGVNSILKPEPQMGFSKGGFLSPDGTCYSFDERGNGYVRSEGAGMMVIKPLAQAEADGDKIYAVILGTAVNQDGATKGISVPNPVAQEALLKIAYDDAGIDPHDVSYVEAHGTGTFVGDPIETGSIGRVIGTNRTNFCYIGSVKSNIGHLEPASGVAGITKLALAMYHKKIAPNIHFQKGNPNIAFDTLKLKVPTEVLNWEVKNGDPRYGGVNSFGFGGANVHVVLQDYQGNNELKANKIDGPVIATISARDPKALRTLATDYMNLMLDKNSPDLVDLAAAMSQRRTHHAKRLAVVGETKEEIANNIQIWLNGETINEVAEDSANETKNKFVFVFSGQGPQWWAMGRQLLAKEELFKEWIHKLDKMLSVHADWSLLEELNRSEETSRISDTNIAQPAIFAVQIALYEMWKAKGIHPGAVIGHSIGEVGAGYASGALTLEQAVILIFHRSRVQFKATDKGRMLAVGVSQKKAEEIIKGREHRVSVGAVNGPEMVSLSGDTDAIEEIAAEMNAKDIFHRMLVVNVPFHSHHMEPLKDELLESLGKDWKPAKSKIPFYSTVAGKIVPGEELDATYWFRNVRDAVLFTAAVESSIKDGFDTFIELGPHPIHAIGINDLLKNNKVKGLVLASLRRKEDERKVFLSAVAKMHVWGAKVDWKNFYGKVGQRIELPRYPWQEESYWLESEEGRKMRLGTIENHPHLKQDNISARESNNIIWTVDLDRRTYPYIEDHKVQGPIVYPGAGHMDLLAGAARASFGDKFAFVEDVNFEGALFLPDQGEPPHIQIDISYDNGEWFLYSKPRKKDAQWTMCSNGKINHIADHFIAEHIDLEAAKKRMTVDVPVKPLHDELLESGLYLGPAFRAIKKLSRSATDWESYSEIEVHDSIKDEFFQFNIHPGVLDSCFQTMFGIFGMQNDIADKMGVYIPRHINRIKWHGFCNSYKLQVYARLTQWSADDATGDLWIFNEDGSLIAEFQGFRSQYLKGSRGEVAGQSDKWFYEYNWKMKSRADLDLLRNPGEFLPSPNSIRKNVQQTIDEIIARPTNNEYFKQYEPDQHMLTMAYICESLENMGMDFSVGAKINVEELKTKLSVIDKQARLFNHMFVLLERVGIIKGGKGNYTVAKNPQFQNSGIWMTELAAKFPQFHHESTLLGRCGPEIQGVLQGTVDPIQLIFPEDQWDGIVQYYVEGFAFGKYNDIASRAVKELIARLPEDQTLRVLEIGAGTGGMSQAILPVLPADRTEYVYTDLSHMFMLKAQQRFAKYPFVKYQILDIESNPGDQGFDLNSFDLIIASDVLHATRRLDVTLANVQNLLASEGVLMMLEVTNNPVYLDFIFGMTEGWWLYEDLDIRPDHATMGPEAWKQVLETNKFHDIAYYSDVPDNSISCQNIIMARSEKRDLSAGEVINAKRTSEADWILFADQGTVVTDIAAQLGGLNKTCYIVRKGEVYKQLSDQEFAIKPLSQADLDRVVDMVKMRGKLQGFIYGWGLDLVQNADLSRANIVKGEDSASMTMLNIMRKLNGASFSENPSIWTLFSGSQTIAGSPELIKMSQMGLRGVARTALNEFPNYRTVLVDFSQPVQKSEIDVFVDELFANDFVDEVAFRGRKRFISRLERVSPENVIEQAKRHVPADGSAYSASITDYGVLDNITLRESLRLPVPEGMVEIQVKAAALNFRDIMMAMGLLSAEAVDGGLYGRNFGLECAGVVSRVGKKSGFKVGDEVLACSKNSIAGFTVAHRDHVVKKPTDMDWGQAAGFPIVYLTAYYALVHQCRIEAGEKVLVHAAAGGVGIAAVNIARALGCEVYATVGSKEKRDYVISLGVKPENIMSSRTLDFADEIMQKTNGYGVDVVINSIAGEVIYKSVRCLAAYGRFVEIGKTDIYRNSKLGLKPFGNNISYFGVDIDRFLGQRIAKSGKMLKECLKFFVENKFAAHPYKEFPVNDLADAFQYMGGARHIGKVVVAMKGEVQANPPLEIRFDDNATYVITGGASGFGLEVANWMLKKGAKHLALWSRSGPKSDHEKELIEKMKASGADIYMAMGSIDNEKDVNRIFREIKKTMPKIKGIQHAAMVLDDGAIPDISRQRYMNGFVPKAVGAWLLHEKTKDMKLDHFIMYSSISSMYGNPGQVSYVAANQFLDNLAHWRRAQGLAATTINWGVIGGAGFVHRSGVVGGLLFKQGWKQFTIKEACGILEQCLLNNPVHRMCADCDWKIIGGFYPHSAKSSRFAHLINEEELGGSGSSGAGDGALKAQILDSKPEEQLGVLLVNLKDTFARVLGTVSDKLSTAEPVTKYGLDSLMANQIRNWVQASIGVDYSMMKIMRGPTMEEMAGHVLDELLGQGSGGGATGESRSELDKWIVRSNIVESPRVRLFCLPYFAGGASIFNSWHEPLPNDVEVCAIQMPGREERADERPFDDINKLVEKMAEVMEPLLTTPIAFYSHSSGAGMCFELVRHLRRKYDVTPVAFMVGGWRAPHLESPFEFLNAIGDDEVYAEKNIVNIKNHMRSLAIPESVINNEALFNEMLPSLRADILLGKRYRYKEEAKFDCPIIAFAGAEDPVFDADQIKSWKDQAAGEFKFFQIGGGHLFCRDNKDELLGKIAPELSVEVDAQ